MGVKVVNCNEKTVSNKSFPKLMISKQSKAIFLVCDNGKGTYECTTLVKGDLISRVVGDKFVTSHASTTSHWEDYNEPLTLQNE